MENFAILLIMNCKKYLKKAKFQTMTWLPQVPSFIPYYHVIGDPELDTSFRFDEENRILWVKVQDDYNSLPKKVMAAYSAVFKTFAVRYVFKTDDDQILVNPRFFEILMGLLKAGTIHYGGHIVHVKQNYLSQYHTIHPELPKYLPILQTKYCSGRFYFLSLAAIQDLLTKREQIEKEYLEDYAVGFHMSPPFKQNMLHLQTNKFFTDIERSDFDKWLAEGRL
jgi:hypothetical protein